MGQMNIRYVKIMLTCGAAAMAVMMLLVVLSGFRRLATSNRTDGSASGSSKDFMSSTNKVALARELAMRGDVSAVSGLILGLRTDSNPAVRAAGDPGGIVVTASSPGLIVGTVRIEAR